jgi:hypothetical protein
MNSRTHSKFFPIVFVLLTAAVVSIAGCNSESTLFDSGTGSAFVVGTDAPMASVTSFAAQVQGICAVAVQTGNPQPQDSACVPLLSGTPTVDFARFNGLQTLLDMNDVPAGTYNQIQITLGAATIGYLNVPASGAPTISTEAATYPSNASTYTYTQTLADPLVIAKAGEPVGLRVDFDLYKSIGVDSNGQITGAVTPTFHVRAVGRGDAGGYIDTFVAAVVSVGTTSFVVQGPHGHQFTIDVNGQTEWENSETIGDLTTSSIVEVSGIMDLADSTLDADGVAILSQNGFYADGQITYVTSATSNVVPTPVTITNFDLYVRGLLPTTTGLTLGQIAQVDLTGSEKFFIARMHDTVLSQFLFNSGTLLAGQPVSVGGPATGAANPDDVTVNRVVLRHWGFNGTILANTANQPAGTFQMQINGFAGVLIPQPVTVYGLTNTGWRFGLTGIGDAVVGDNVRVVGLLLNVSGQPVLLAHYVDDLDDLD